MIYKTVEEAEEALAYWQKVLRLQDWKITLRLLDDYDMGDALGRNDCFWSKKVAILELNLNCPSRLKEIDHEWTLVHELLHIHTRPIIRRLDAKDFDGNSLPEEETAINMIADALIALNRK